jgi:hypothetical protein
MWLMVYENGVGVLEESGCEEQGRGLLCAAWLVVNVNMK